MINFLKREKIQYMMNEEDTCVYKYDAFLGHGEVSIVIAPSSKDELKKIVHFLNKNNKKYLVRGTGTNYSGAVQAQNGEIIVTTHKMKKEFEKCNKYLYRASTSISLGEINKLLENEGVFYPPDPASQRVCTLGGTIAMNAGGARCYKYGVTGNYIRELDIVTPCFGEVTLGHQQLYAIENYPVKHLFIGSEGTLGVVESAIIEVLKKPKFSKEFIAYFSNYEDAVRFIEYIVDGGLMASAIDMSTDPYIPNSGETPGAKLIISLEDDLENIVIDKFNRMKKMIIQSRGELEKNGELHIIRSSVVKDNIKAILARSDKQVYFLFDTVVPRSKLMDILRYCYILSDHFKLPILNTYHAGDGNIHPTVFYNSLIDSEFEKLKLFMYLIIKKSFELGGAVTGEHGVGIEKRDIQYVLNNAYTNSVYANIKNIFDKENILNRDKVIGNETYSKKFLNEIKYISQKYKMFDLIEVHENEKHSPDVRDGLLELNTLNAVSNNSIQSEICIPYFPIVNAHWNWDTHFKVGLPSFADDLYKLDYIVRSIETLSGVKVGKKTLKNVEGYNLVPLYMATKTISKATFKVIPKKDIENRYYIFNKVCMLSEALEIMHLTTCNDEILNCYYNSETSELCIISIIKNPELNNFTKQINVMKYNFGNYDEFYIASLCNCVDLNTMPFDKWIFVGKENTLLILKDKINSSDEKWLNENSLTLRKVSEKGSELVSIEKKYIKQIEILENLKRYI